MFLYIENVIF